MRSFFSKPKMWLGLQALALAGGTVVGWSTVLREVQDFCDQQGRGLWSLTQFDGTFTTNPLATPCFWGSIVFLIAFAWTASLLMEKSDKKVRWHMRRLWWLLLAGTLFAFVNNIPVFYTYYTQPGATSCGGGSVSNPFVTSCFLGLVAFALAFVFACAGKRSLKRQ